MKWKTIIKKKLLIKEKTSIKTLKDLNVYIYIFYVFV